MDLESPTKTVCPLHAAVGEQHMVEIKENSTGKPYFQCEDLKTTVNLHADDAEDFAVELRELTEQTGVLNEPDDDESESDGDGEAEESADRNTLADILGDNDE